MSPGNTSALRVAAVGLGYWGPNLARAWAGLETAELRWLCDVDEDNLARVGARHPEVALTGDLDEVLGDPEVDAVSIATGVPTHGPLALRALEAGKHVFVEKPLAMSGREAREVAAAADARGLTLAVGHLLVHHPGVAKLKELYDRGELGEIHYLYTNRVNLGQVRGDENALWSLGAHDVSVLLHLVGEPPIAASAHGQCFIRPGVEDVVFALLRFERGVVAHMQLSWLDPRKTRRITVVGSRKMAVFDDMQPDERVKVFDKGVAYPANVSESNGERAWRPPVSYGEYVQLRFGDTYVPRISSEEPLRIQCRHFVRCVRGEETPRAGGAEGVAVVEILEALQSSLQRGGDVVPVAVAPVA